MSIFREHKTVADRSASDRRRGTEVTCQKCGLVFLVKASYAKRAKFCSRLCSASRKRGTYKNKVKISCKTCLKVFEKLPCFVGVKFCSVKCKGKSYKRTINRKCLICHVEFETTSAKNKQYCSKKCHHSSLVSGKSFENMRATNLEKYGVEHVSQSNEFKLKKHESMKRNKTYGKSKIEDRVFNTLVSLYGKDAVERQLLVNGWSIDFYLKTKQIYLQVDGVYWHGLDRPIEIIKNSKVARDAYIFSHWEKDAKQNQWFLENNLKLIRITDKQIKSYDDLKEGLAHTLGGS